MTSARPGQLRLGWQYATAYANPGPPPRRPTPPETERLSPDWAAAQRREESQTNRPLKAALGVAVIVGLVLVALGAAGSLGALVTGLGVTCCALLAAVSGYALWQGERALRSRMTDERARIGRAREAQESRLFAWQAEHAAQMHTWQARQLAYEQQKHWYAVGAPQSVPRVDIAGGTLSGWSALLTTAAVSRMVAGGEITVFDLTGGAVALDLLGFARASGTDPLVWVLPGDLPRLELVPLPRSELRVIALDRRMGAIGSQVLGTYLTTALTHLLRGVPPAPPGRHTVFVLGADKLSGDTLDRLSDGCERSATGLVLAYREIPAHVRSRLGRGNAVLAFMRLAGAEDARAASELLETGRRVALAQLTETVGGSVADTAGGTYTSTASPVGDAHGIGESEQVSAWIRTSTAWGMATAKAVADGGPPAEARRRSREFLTGPDVLQQLPASAMIVSYAGPDGRQVVLADANPGIGGLETATQLTLEEFRSRPAGGSPDPGSGAPDPDVPSPGASRPAAVPGRPAPNLGPPPRRLDWRRGRS
jgi:hypothetical protein